jgi:hypothetical protein
MKAELFEELLESVRQGGAILVGRSLPHAVLSPRDRRRPTGPAAALLTIIANDPELALRAIHLQKPPQDIPRNPRDPLIHQ